MPHVGNSEQPRTGAWRAAATAALCCAVGLAAGWLAAHQWRPTPQVVVPRSDDAAFNLFLECTAADWGLDDFERERLLAAAESTPKFAAFLLTVRIDEVRQRVAPLEPEQGRFEAVETDSWRRQWLILRIQLLESAEASPEIAVAALGHLGDHRFATYGVTRRNGPFSAARATRITPTLNDAAVAYLQRYLGDATPRTPHDYLHAIHAKSGGSS